MNGYDTTAVTTVADDDAGPVRTPELLWGAKQDASSNYPKHVLRRAIGRSPHAEDFAEIALAADLDIIAERCPISFAPFLEALRDTAARCAAASSSQARANSR